ncbi:MAG: feruloyl-CoA synthase [Ramlibacter sp.]|jgi:feruloyl-CoA synthase|nr:feruloyl-CoA synthase [Ramlibacter sp.]
MEPRMTHPFAASYRPVRLGQCHVEIREEPDGALLVSQPEPLGPYARKLGERLVHWARLRPDQTWLAQRGADGQWVRISYAEGLRRVRTIAGALLRRGLDVDRPVLILSGNDLDHAMLAVACMYAGIAYAPVATAYSLVSRDFAKLRHITDLLTPGLVFASDGAQFGAALAAIAHDGLEVLVAANPPPGATAFAALREEGGEALADAAHDRVGPDTIAKFLFTSGSSGMPKAVINTQRMLCSNMAMSAAHFAYLEDEPPVTLEWAPWNHTAGGNHNFNIVLYLGGTLHIDDGKPVPGLVETTIRNLREVSPNWYMNVPRGYAAILPYLQQDQQLRESFFRNLKLCMYAGAGIEPHVWRAIDELAVQTTGRKVFFTTSLGSTETAPLALVADQSMAGAGVVGVPARGIQLKLVGPGPRWEARLKGPNITPGYWRSPQLTAAAFDEDGFYKLGDALRFVDPDDVNQGFRFDGRFGEDFKLATGTWVAAGPLRLGWLEAAAPLLQDAVIVGANQDRIGALVFLDVPACARLVGDGAATLDTLADHPALRAELARRLVDFAARATGSSTRIERITIARRPPSMERGELTDKGAISQAGVLSCNQELIAALFAAEPGADVICANQDAH